MLAPLLIDAELAAALSLNHKVWLTRFDGDSTHNADVDVLDDGSMKVFETDAGYLEDMAEHVSDEGAALEEEFVPDAQNLLERIEDRITTVTHGTT